MTDISDTTTVPTPEVKLTQLQAAILSELSARVQLGYNVWTYSSKLTKTLMTLEELGYVNWKSASSEGLIIAWFTLKGRQDVMPEDGYRAPVFDDYVSKEKYLTLELKSMQLTKQIAELNEINLDLSNALAETNTKQKSSKKAELKKKATKGKDKKSKKKTN